MLKNLHEKPDKEGVEIKVSEAGFPAIFPSGLEYSSPARGHWNIVNTGLLVPETHLIYICAASCLRGVVLTAAEQGLQDRFSTIAIRENNVLSGDNEEMIVEGVGDVISRLPYKPKAFMVYTSCVQTFIGCDLQHTFKTLRETYPDFHFIDGYMYPIMRKTSMPPIPQTRITMYSLIDEREKNSRRINLIGNNLKTDRTGRFWDILEANGYELKEIQDCENWEDFQEMGSAVLNLVFNPTAVPAAKVLKKKHGQDYIYIPFSHDSEEIAESLNKVLDKLGIAREEWTEEKTMASKALQDAKALIGDTPVVIDYTAVTRPLGLAKVLLNAGFNVKKVYMDTITADEKADFEYLQKNYPDLLLNGTVNPKMRFLHHEKADEKWLAIGQQASYFIGSNNYVDTIENGGMYGYEGVVAMAEWMKDAFTTEKDAKSLIQIKGWGCGSCI
ncbi:MAG: nitrogenase component 1 [Clostridia bacterium]|nr:nitrogenase component 1 [Clostridia bacterium]